MPAEDMELTSEAVAQSRRLREDAATIRGDFQRLVHDVAARRTAVHQPGRAEGPVRAASTIAQVAGISAESNAALD